MRPRQHCDGVSLLPLLRRRRALPQRDLFWHYPHYSNQGGTPACSMVAGDWKLIEFFEDGRLELYDLREDREERHDLAASRPERRPRTPRTTRPLARRGRGADPQAQPQLPAAGGGGAEAGVDGPAV